MDRSEFAIESSGKSLMLKKNKHISNGGIPEGWKTKTLGEICVDIAYGYTASAKNEPVGPKFLRITDIQDESLDWKRVPYCEISAQDRLKYKLEMGDVCIARTGASTGTNYTIKENVDAVFASYLIRYKIDKNIANPFYVGHLLRSSLWKEYVKSIIGGSAQPGANAKQFAGFEFILPSIPEQEAIAKILSDLDAKIELNHQMNKTLESIAQAIFKQWFVDFEFPGYKKTKFVDGLPEGWREGCFGDILKVSIGGDWGQDSEFEGAVQAVSLRGADLGLLKTSGYAADAPIRWVRKDKLDRRIINNKNILIGGSGLGPIGKTIYCSKYLNNLYEFPITYSNFCKCLLAESPAFAAYAEKILENIYLSGEMRRFFTGTSIPNLDTASLMRYPILIPARKVVEDFYNVIREKYAQQFNKEKLVLSQIRDSLLPKLMSGKIRVKT